MTNTNNYYRVTAYHPGEDITILIDSNGKYEKLWQLSSELVQKGFDILEVSDSSKFVGINIGLAEHNPNKVFLRACMVGKPDIFIQTVDGKRVKVLQVENKMYIPDKNVAA